MPLTIQLPGRDPIGILPVGSPQVSRIPDQTEEPPRPKGDGEISGGLRTPSVYRATAESALRRAKLCLELNEEVTANRPSARPGKVALGIGSALKANIIDQAFTWYPIRGSITNTS